MDQRAEVSEFLRSRRGRITPKQAGITTSGRRRVPGLRREEVAALAGVSVEYYARMERGDLAGVSSEVLDALARTLQLDEAEYDHLGDLARAAGPALPQYRQSTLVPSIDRDDLQRFLDAVTELPLWVRDLRMNFVAANALGHALYSPVLDDPETRKNIALFIFLSPQAKNFLPDWERNADDLVATLRTYLGQRPHDRYLVSIKDELLAKSSELRSRWTEHNVRYHRTGVKRICHSVVGDLQFSYHSVAFPGNPDWLMFAFLPDPGSVTEERMKNLR